MICRRSIAKGRKLFNAENADQTISDNFWYNPITDVFVTDTNGSFVLHTTLYHVDVWKDGKLTTL